MAILQPYAKRAITVTFKMGGGSYGEGSGGSTIVHKGLRVTFQSEWASLVSKPMAFIRIYGLTLSEMNALTKAGLRWEARMNEVQVDAGDVGGAMVTVYRGTIFEAYPDMKEMPNSAFWIAAISNGEDNVKAVPPVTFDGPTPFKTCMEQILKPTTLTHEDNGVNAILSSPYFDGGAMAQVQSALRAANCFGVVDPLSAKLATWPKDGHRSGGDVPLIAPETGMIGYPEFEKNTVRVRSRFNGSTLGGPGTQIRIKSDLTAADGIWTLIRVDLNLASELPDGPWEISLMANAPGVG